MNPPKPTKLKIIQGTFRKDRATTNEPQPEVGVPAVPSHLSDEAKVEWGRISQELEKLGLLSRIDRAALAVYCQAWARWVKAENKIAELEKEIGSGELMRAPSGYLVRNEWLNVANKAIEQLDKFGAKFGMDPSSRTRINTSPREEQDELDSFARKRNKKA